MKPIDVPSAPEPLMKRLACLSLMFLSACHAPEPAPTSAEGGRAETQNIRNLDAVGVPGSAIADKVDGALNAAEQRNRDLQAQDPN